MTASRKANRHLCIPRTITGETKGTEGVLHPALLLCCHVRPSVSTLCTAALYLAHLDAATISLADLVVQSTS